MNFTSIFVSRPVATILSSMPGCATAKCGSRFTSQR